MSDIKNALAQLRAARNGEEIRNGEELHAGHPAGATVLPALSGSPVSPTSGPDQDQVSAETTPTARGEIKTLAGRVPLPLHRELTRGLLDAADELKVSKINIDEALEAAIRVVLREGAATQLWYAQLREVRRERRES